MALRSLSSGISCFPRRPASFSLPPQQCRRFQIRNQSRYPYPRGRPQYNRFSRAQNIKILWQNSPVFRYGVGATGAGMVGFVGYNIETVPVSGRRRFNWVNPEYEEQMALEQYQQVIRQYQTQILPPSHPATRLVQKVLERLIPSTGLDGQNWEVNVIDDNQQMNAFVIPG